MWYWTSCSCCALAGLQDGMLESYVRTCRAQSETWPDRVFEVYLCVCWVVLLLVVCVSAGEALMTLRFLQPVELLKAWKALNITDRIRWRLDRLDPIPDMFKENRPLWWCQVKEFTEKKKKERERSGDLFSLSNHSWTSASSRKTMCCIVFVMC